MAIKLEGGGGEGKALMAWPLVGELFSPFPNCLPTFLIYVNKTFRFDKKRKKRQKISRIQNKLIMFIFTLFRAFLQM